MSDQTLLHSKPDRASETLARQLRTPDVGMRQVVAMAAAMWLVTRIALVTFTYFTVLLGAGGTAQHATPVAPSALAHVWLQWDAKWYLQIAQSGYFSEQSTAYFPLYPLLVRVVGVIIGGHWLAAALLVSNLGTLGGFIGLALLAAHEFGSARSAALAVNALAAYPLAFFLAAPYTEGPFIALVAFALFFARTGRSQWAAGCVFLAMLTRPTGLALIAPLLWEHGRQRGWRQAAPWRALWAWRQAPRWPRLSLISRFVRRSRRSLLEGVVVISAAPSALALYMGYLAARFGDPLLFLHAEQRYWGHGGSVSQGVTSAAPHVSPAPPVSPFALTYDQARSLVDLLPLAIVLVLAVVIARRLPVMYTLYMAGLLFLCVSSPRPDRLGIFVSAGRYLCAALPVFLQLGRWAQDRPWLETLIVSLGFLVQAALAAVFLSGGWLV